VPFLRVLRDKRGYETSYLMHWFREGNRQRSRILYVFRTPGGVRVGRTALDRDVLRDLEARYPEIAFDWNAVRENQQVIEAAPDVRRRRPRREEPDEIPEAPPAPPPAAAPTSAARTPGDSVIPASITGSTPDEQIAFLLEWYPIVKDRIASRTSEPERQKALAALAERLNPTAWTDADQITTGLQQASEALERLSRVFTRRRRRARRRPRPAASEGARQEANGAGEEESPA
jgi:hypothetical protein